MIWMSKKEADARKELFNKMEKAMAEVMWGTYVPPTPRPEDNVKIAYVYINGEKQMLGVDNKTMQGYEMEENIPTFKIPLVKKDYEAFDRWCILMDM